MPVSLTHSAPSAAEALRELGATLGSRLEAELLLAHALKVERSWLYAHGEAELGPEQHAALLDLVLRRQAGEPIAYLLGQREFYGRNFRVSPAVLIPRPETELLVETVLEKLPPTEADVVDIGTGSGCIALSLAAERPDWRVTAVDLSADALAVCAKNAALLELPQVELLQGDLLEPVRNRRFDAIVSNPPYVAAGDPHLARGDLRFEPDLALSAGEHGLALIGRLVPQAVQCLRPGGWLLIEHGHDQASQVRELFEQAGFLEVESRRDLAAIERITLGRRGVNTE